MQCNNHLRNASLQTRDIQLKEKGSRDIEKCDGGIQGKVSTSLKPS